MDVGVITATGSAHDASSVFFNRLSAAWQGRDLGTRLLPICHPDAVFHSAWGKVSEFGGAELALLPLMQAMPSAEFLGEDMICADTSPVVASLRGVIQGTLDGDGEFGPKTGQGLSFRVAGELYLVDGKIAEAFLIRDTSAILNHTQEKMESWVSARQFKVATDVPEPEKIQGNDTVWGSAWRDILCSAMDGNGSKVAQHYDIACRQDLPGGRINLGSENAALFWTTLRASFPTARFSIQHAIGQENTLLPPRASVRWTIRGRHDGWGAYGAPTGKKVVFSGVSQCEFGPDGVRREFTLFDEAAVWTQILSDQAAEI